MLHQFCAASRTDSSVDTRLSSASFSGQTVGVFSEFRWRETLWPQAVLPKPSDAPAIAHGRTPGLIGRLNPPGHLLCHHWLCFWAATEPAQGTFRLQSGLVSSIAEAGLRTCRGSAVYRTRSDAPAPAMIALSQRRGDALLLADIAQSSLAARAAGRLLWHHCVPTCCCTLFPSTRTAHCTRWCRRSEASIAGR
jgi:hypothetical protein